MFKVVVYKNYGPFEFEFSTYEDALAYAKDRWFSPSVWDVRLFSDEGEVDISKEIAAMGARPVYC